MTIFIPSIIIIALETFVMDFLIILGNEHW